MPNILIAEDERPIADLIRMTLKGAGYRCDWAPDGDRPPTWPGLGSTIWPWWTSCSPGATGLPCWNTAKPWTCR